MQKIFLSVFLLGTLFFLPSLSFSDSVEYFYDDNGRLVKVSKTDNTRVLYQYDEVGNLIGIYKETSASQALPPVLQGIDPDILLIDETYNVVISGQNLLTATSVTSDNPDITIKFIAAIDSKIIVVLSIANTASPGQATITVTTSYGSASRSVNLYGVNITPKAVLSFPSRTISFSAALTPSAASDLTVKVNNENADIIDTALTITIPAGGTINFDATTLRPGRGVIKIGNEKIIIDVIGDFYDSKPVSVALEIPSSIGEASVSSNSVSVAIGINSFDFITTESTPVSVFINVSSSDIATVESMPVSVNVGGFFDIATSVSAPVSVLISSSSSDIATVESVPVSVNVGGSFDTATSVSTPVSVFINISSSDIATVESMPVSVNVGGFFDTATSVSAPVSVLIDSSDVDIATLESIPVSVNVGGFFDTATSVSASVSVLISSSSFDIATSESASVSVIIEKPDEESVISANNVSVRIDIDSSGSVTKDSVPVSVLIQAPQLADAVTVSQPVSTGWCTNGPVKVSGSATTYYTSLQDAYNAASNGDTIQSQFGDFAGDVTMDDVSDKSVTLEGGYNCDYTAVIGVTNIKGNMTINRGTVTIRNFILKQ